MSTLARHYFPVLSVTALFWTTIAACAVTSVIDGLTPTVHEWMRMSTESLVLTSTQNGSVLVVYGQRSPVSRRIKLQVGVGSVRTMVLW